MASNNLLSVFALCLSGLLWLAPLASGNPEALANERYIAEATTKTPIKIGFVCSLTGSAAKENEAMLRGFQLYLDQVHRQAAGRPIDVQVEDDEASPSKAMIKVKKFVEHDHVSLISGIFFSSIFYSVAPLSDQYKIPFAVSQSGADDISQRKRRKWAFRTSWSSSQPSHPFGEYAAKQLKHKNIVTFASDYSFSHEVIGGFQEAFEQNGGHIIQKIWVPLDAQDFTNQLSSIDKRADAVLMCLVGQSAPLAVEQYVKLGCKFPILANSNTFDELYLRSIGDKAVGAISASPYSAALDTAANRNFVNAYKAKHGEAPGWYAESGYTNAMWIVQALNTLKGNVDDSEKLLAALKEVTLDNAPRGKVSLDQYGSPVQNIYIRQIQEQKGEYVNKPIYTYQSVSQFWKWNPDEYLAKPAYTKNNPPCTYCNK